MNDQELEFLELLVKEISTVYATTECVQQQIRVAYAKRAFSEYIQSHSVCTRDFLQFFLLLRELTMFDEPRRALGIIHDAKGWRLSLLDYVIRTSKH